MSNKLFCLELSNFNFYKYRSSLKTKGGKWTDKTLDKWLKSPADYAPGKFKVSLKIVLYKIKIFRLLTDIFKKI